jgi:Na+/glutamate symporter
MQKTATRIFICSSIAFGILGILLVLTLPGRDENSSDLNMTIMRLLMVTVFVILPSFALSVASKYLKNKS